MQKTVDVTVRPIAYASATAIDCLKNEGRGFIWRDKGSESDVPLYAIPEGWALVPVYPTPEMTKAAHAVEHCGNSEPHFANAYTAMVSAVPDDGGER